MLVNLNKKSLRLRIMAVVGLLIVSLMIVISVGILVQWRSMILQQLHKKAESTTRAFGISVLDVLIYSETENFQVRDLLESYISDLKTKIPDIRSIVILDNQRRVIAHDDPQMYNQVLDDELTRQLIHISNLVSGIYYSPQLNWIIETVLPLKIAGKRWGILRIAFDAQQTRQEIARLFFLLLGIIMILTFVVLVALNYLIKQNMQSLKVLVKAMDAMELETDYAFQLPQREDEIGALIRHFEMFRKRLAASQEQLLSAQKQIYQAEKLASIGRLASGVAHEINNPLNGIKHCLYAIQKEPQNQQQLEKYLPLINEGLEHIESVVKKLLGFSRKSSQENQWINLNETITQVVALLEYRLNQKQVELQLDLADNLPLVRADASRLKEVIMNLLLNSFDAVEAKGRISIKTEMQSPALLSLTVQDDGKGIAPEDLDKIFDPFFTTKDVGEGTGLGLAVALSIIEAHGGKIEVESQPNQGSKFTVLLPLGENK